MGRSGSILLWKERNFLEFFICAVGSPDSCVPLRCALYLPLLVHTRSSMKDRAAAHSPLCEEDQRAIPQVLCSCLLGRTAACWSSCGPCLLGEPSALHPSPSVATEWTVIVHLLVFIWNPSKVLEMHWASFNQRDLMQWQYSHAKKLPHPFSNNFVKLSFICLGYCFLLYRRNYGYHLIIPLSFIGSTWTWKLCFSVFSPLADLLCCFYPLPL